MTIRPLSLIVFTALCALFFRFFRSGRRVPAALAAALLLAGALPAQAQEWTHIHSYGSLSSFLENARSGKYYLILDDEIAPREGEEGPLLIVSSELIVTLDLNGHNINRGLTAPEANGSVIYVSGNLTIMNSAESGGMITGGKTTADGGGIYNNGTLTIGDGVIITGNSAGTLGGGVYNYRTFNMDGGEISGNTAGTLGGGVYNSGSGTFNMTNGTITGNTASDAGGVEVSDGTFNLHGGAITGNKATGGEGVASIGGVGYRRTSELNISGSPVVTGNTANGKASNVHNTPSNGDPFTVDGELKDGASIGVSMYDPNPGVFTTGLPGNGDGSCFFSNDPDYYVEIVPEGEQKGEAKLTKKSGTAVTPVISPDGGTHTRSVQVTITTETEGASIYYTTNGSEPTKESTLYADAFMITESCTVKAIAVRNDLYDSGIVSAEFTIEAAVCELEVSGVEFDDVTYGYEQPAAQALTITNNCSAGTEITGAELGPTTVTKDGGEDPAAFILNKTGGTTVPAGSTDTSYTVQPASGLGAGTYTADFIVHYNGTTASGEVSITVLKAVDPAEITAAAGVTAGGNRVDLSENVRGAVGDVSYAIEGDAKGCSLNETTGVLTSGDEGGDVIVEITVAESDNYNGKTAFVTVTVREKAQKELAVSVSEEDPTVPVYDMPEGTIPETVKVIYSGTTADGTKYGPSPAAPSEAGDYTVTVTLETADTIFSGSADFTLSEPEPGPEPEPEPERPGIDFFRLHADCELPATGFSALRPTFLPEQPKDLRYEQARMHLMLPTLDRDVELVTMPREGNSWAAAWLGADAGILEGSALPGEGVSIIAGHNTLNDTDYGPFALLGTLEVNDTVMVREESGALKLFLVYANELLEPDDMDRLSALAGDDALVLLTCENESASGGYLNRRAVFAKENKK